MEISKEQKQRIRQFIPVYRQYAQSDEFSEDREKRQQRQALYTRILSQNNIDQMTELEFGQFISSLWASQMWGNKSYLVDNLLRDNDLANLKANLTDLLWGKASIAVRYDVFKKATKGFGTAIITELLAFTYPEQCGVWNDKARKALALLGFKETHSFITKSQLKGQEYQRYNELLLQIQNELVSLGFADIDLLGINYFFFEVSQSEKIEEGETETIKVVSVPTPPGDFDHDDVIDKLVAMGIWLGFDAEKEKHIAPGAKVDVVWQAKIANLGVVTYVLEVQRKGSIDSLILNLQKAQNNPSVQRLVVVATSKDIEKIQNEIKVLPESFRKAVSYMEVFEALHASELLNEFSEIIDKLQLVQSEFAIPG